MAQPQRYETGPPTPLANFDSLHARDEGVSTPLYDLLSESQRRNEAVQSLRYPTETEHRHVGDDRSRAFIASPNHSPRGGAKVRLLVLHTAEGARTVQELGRWFADPKRQVSSHVGIDDRRIEQYVSYDQACWATRSANPISESAELCGFASWSRAEWLDEHRGILDLAATWLAERSRARGIPLRKLSPEQVAAGESGVCGHVDWTVGMHDGTHTDPGEQFPWDYVMSRATAITPPPEESVLAVDHGVFDPGDDMRETLSCPVGPDFLFKDGYFSLGVGWNDATNVSVVFVGKRLPNGQRVYLPGGVTDQVLPFDDWRALRIPQGTTLISVAYDSANPIGWCTELSTQFFG